MVTISARARDFLFSLTPRQTLKLKGTAVRQGVILTNHVYPEPRVKINGSIPPLPLFTFVSRIGTTLPRPMTRQKPTSALFHLFLHQENLLFLRYTCFNYF